jgi:sec-independent protein translocase protein TatA
MLAALEGPDLVIVLVVLLVLFGGAQLPKLAKNIGEAKREFEAGLRDETEPGEDPGDSSTPS